MSWILNNHIQRFFQHLHVNIRRILSGVRAFGGALLAWLSGAYWNNRGFVLERDNQGKKEMTMHACGKTQIYKTASIH